MGGVDGFGIPDWGTALEGLACRFVHPMDCVTRTASVVANTSVRAMAWRGRQPPFAPTLREINRCDGLAGEGRVYEYV